VGESHWLVVWLVNEAEGDRARGSEPGCSHRPDGR
jgi:hypothetical protein